MKGEKDKIYKDKLDQAFHALQDQTKKYGYYYATTDSKGVAKFDTKNLSIGSYSVSLAPTNAKYKVSGSSKITISE